MMNKAMTHLILGLAAVALLGVPVPATYAQTAAGKVLYAFGSAKATGKDGQTRTLRRGRDVFPGDKLATGRRGRAQVRFTDGGFISLRRNSEFQIDEYRYAGKTDGSERGFFSLLKGALRSVTGAVGRANRQTYRIKTPVATIGIRGTSFLLTLCAGDCFAADGSPIPDGLYASTGDGTITVTNAAGVLNLVAGQSSYTQDENSAPQQTSQPAPLAIDTTGGATTDDPFQVGSQRESGGELPGAPGGGTAFDVFTDQVVTVAHHDLADASGIVVSGDVDAFVNALIVTGSPGLLFGGESTDDGELGFAFVLPQEVVDALVEFFPELAGTPVAVAGTAMRETLLYFDDPGTPPEMGPDLLITRWYDGTAVIGETVNGAVAAAEVTLEGNESLLFASSGNPTLADPMAGGMNGPITGFADFELMAGVSIPVFSPMGSGYVVPGSGQMFLQLGGGSSGYGQVSSLSFDINYDNQIVQVYGGGIPLEVTPLDSGGKALTIGYGSISASSSAGSYSGNVSGILIGNESTVAGPNTPTHAATSVIVRDVGMPGNDLTTIAPWDRTNVSGDY